MQRRNFLKMASALGTVVPAWALTPAAFAQTAPYAGRILINIHASGGIDQSSWTDPRETDPAINAYAGTTPAGIAGNIRYAPMGGAMGANSSNKTFFDRYFRQMLVINGVHSETNGHDEGTRAHATGRLDMGYPNVAELFAATHGKTLPMPWLNSGGFNMSAGLVPPTPVPDQTVWRAMARPNSVDQNQDFMKDADVNRVIQARTERLKALQARGDMLPRTKQMTDQFLDSSGSRVMLDRVAQYTPANFNGQFTQAHIGLVAAQAGITSTVQLSTGGFDAHNNIVNSYNGSLTRLTDLVDFVWQTSATLGLADRVFLRIYSEFGRTPMLNSGNGKDHWAIGSQVLMEANPRWGNRVFGASGPKHEMLKFTSTGAPDPANGKTIYPRHIHAAMREYLGINTTDPKFDLKVPANERFDFFNPANSTGYPTL
jgi:uncharacterized protein (DUF1501 family)